MNVTGIIMECNPFHEGHAYLLREARRRTCADYIVVAMSGDYVQRGEPAVFDKYIRAEQILRAGADLVLELPLYAACGSAEYFAQGGTALLDRLGVVTDLCFGSESGNTGYILENARLLAQAENSPSPYQKILKAGLRAGLTFPAARAAALEEVSRETASQKEDFPADPHTGNASSGENSFFENRSSEENSPGNSFMGKKNPGKDSLSGYPSSPNDLLAVEYCRALLSSGSSIRPQAIPRIAVPSATERRKQLLQNRETGTFSVREDMSVKEVPLYPLSPDDFSDHLLYALRMRGENLGNIADISGDLASRIRNLLPQYRKYTQFRDLLKTRNLTRTRISRGLLHHLLQIENDRLCYLKAHGMALYARPLAMNRAAAPLFSRIMEHASIPFLPKLSAASSVLTEKAADYLSEEIRAEELYTLTLASVFSRNSGISTDSPRAEQRRIVCFYSQPPGSR